MNADSPIASSPVSASPVRVSVVIPVRNDPVRLRRCLQALEEQTLDAHAFDVWVVDDKSDEPIDDLIAEFPHARLIRLETDIGGAFAARNHANALTTAPVIACTDADCVPDARWLESGLAALDRLDGLGMVTGDVQSFYPDPDRPNGAAVFDAVLAFPQESYVKRDGFGVTANLLVPRPVLDAVGPFNELAMDGGDMDFGRRATAMGIPTAYDAAVIVAHPTRRDARAIRYKWDRSAKSLEWFRRTADPTDAPGPRHGPAYYFKPRLGLMARVLRDRRLGPLLARLSACALILQQRPLTLYYAWRARRMSDQHLIGRYDTIN
ncbi:MAG: glycosyltransferase [Planctomycetota bacterium]